MYNAANNAWSKLAQGITADATSLIVEGASSFPEPPFVVSIDDEIIEVGSKTTNTLSSLVRGVEGTTPAAHVSGVRVENRFTAGTYQGVVDEVLTHLDDTENPHAVTAAQIGAETPFGAQAKVNLHAAELVTQAGGVHGLEMESGTFTPTVQAATTAATVTYVVRQGYYIKVGKMATCEFFIRCKVTGGTGTLEVVDWPFTASNPRAGGVMLLFTLHGVGLGGMAIQYYTTNKCRIRKYDGNLIDISQVNDGKELDIQASITYQIA